MGNNRFISCISTRHLDLHELWVPNAFAIYTFRVVMYSIQVGSKYPTDLLCMNLATHTSRFRALPFVFGPFFRSNIRTPSWKYCYLIWIRRHAPRPSLGLAWRMFCPKSYPSSPVRVSVSVALIGLFLDIRSPEMFPLWNWYRPIGVGDYRFPLEASQAKCDD